MKPLHLAARNLAERFTGERLDRVETSAALKSAASELREAALNWIEHHIDRKLNTRTLLETA